MEPLMFIMAILGCGEGDAPCREVTVAQASYRSESDCLTAAGIELMRHDDLPYPTVVAQCRRAGAAPQPLRAIEIVLPEPDAGPFARPRYAEAAPRRSGRP